MKLVLLNGFDRSGSSMIAGLLGAHPGVAAFYQPFSRTEVHRSQHEIWPVDRASAPTRAFLEGLVEGHVDASYLGADYFRDHSTHDRPQPDRLNVVKDTKLHFQLPWLRANFPEIDLIGLWREPRAILASLVRNGFDETWYGARALERLGPTLAGTPELGAFLPFAEEAIEPWQATAVVVAARTDFMAAHLGARDWLVYEDVVADADSVLGEFVARYGLPPHPFSRDASRDFNVSGRPFERTDLWRDLFRPTQLAWLDRLFDHVRGPATRLARA